jgi:lambda family phage minor tail protein L
MLIDDLQELDIDTEITMFELSNVGNTQNSFTGQNLFGDIFRFTNYNGVIWNGFQYSPIPCEIEGISYTSEGTIPRPKFRISDAGKVISGLIFFYGGLEGAKLTVRRTLKKFLDYQNTADPNAEKPKDIYIISQKLSEIPGKIIEFELSADIDFVEEFLPRRLCSRDCPWIYRGSDGNCGYTGSAYFNLSNQRVLTLAEDACAKTVDACQLRFGKNAYLRHGGFPTGRRI